MFVNAGSSDHHHLSPAILRLLRLQLAISLLTLVQACTLTISCEVAQPQTRKPCMQWLGLLTETSRALIRPDLRAVLALLLDIQLLLRPDAESQISLTWDRYTQPHMHGRLLPGCFFLGCTNLSGVSKAALKTQLCSGCGRARYCSAERQRAAWVQGGHSTLCDL